MTEEYSHMPSRTSKPKRCNLQRNNKKRLFSQKSEISVFVLFGISNFDLTNSLLQRRRGTTKWWMRRSPFCGFHVFREPCFYANESLCHKTKSIKQRVAHSHGDLLIHHLRWSPERRLFLAKVATRGKPRVVLRWRRLSVKLQFIKKGRDTHLFL